jgi:hypothetical protein
MQVPPGGINFDPTFAITTCSFQVHFTPQTTRRNPRIGRCHSGRWTLCVSGLADPLSYCSPSYYQHQRHALLGLGRNASRVTSVSNEPGPNTPCQKSPRSTRCHLYSALPAHTNCPCHHHFVPCGCFSNNPSACTPECGDHQLCRSCFSSISRLPVDDCAC